MCVQIPSWDVLPFEKTRIIQLLQWKSNVSLQSTLIPSKADLYLSFSNCANYTAIVENIRNESKAIVSDGTSLFVDPSVILPESYYLFEVQVRYVNGQSNKVLLFCLVKRYQQDVRFVKLSLVLKRPRRMNTTILLPRRMRTSTFSQHSQRVTTEADLKKPLRVCNNCSKRMCFEIEMF